MALDGQMVVNKIETAETAGIGDAGSDKKYPE